MLLIWYIELIYMLLIMLHIKYQYSAIIINLLIKIEINQIPLGTGKK